MATEAAGRAIGQLAVLGHPLATEFAAGRGLGDASAGAAAALVMHEVEGHAAALASPEFGGETPVIVGAHRAFFFSAIRRLPKTFVQT